MPNTGKPSRDCHLCRARRVKCDLTRPGCSRCAKFGKKCPGYRQEADLLFRNENVSSFAKARPGSRRKTSAYCENSLSPQDEEQLSRSVTGTPPSRRGDSWQDSFQSTTPLHEDIFCPADHLDCGESDFSNSAHHDFIVLTAPAEDIEITSVLATFPAPISNHWEDFFIPFILDRFSAPFHGGRFLGLLDFLPDLYQNVCNDSCLILASKAVAWAYWTNEPLTTLSVSGRARVYGNALGSINQALRDPSEAIKDATVMAIWLLSIYEVMVGARDDQKVASLGAWNAHSQGLTTLLRLRGREQFSTSSGRNIFRLVHEIILARCFVANVEYPKESLEWFEILHANLAEHDEPVVVVSMYSYNVSCILPRIRTLVALGNIEEALHHAPSIIAKSDAIEAEMLTWLRSEKVSSRINPGDLPLLPTWNMYRVVRSKLHESLVTFFGLLGDLSTLLLTPEVIQERLDHSILIVQEMTDEILETIPYAMGDPSIRDEDLQLIRPRAWPDALRLLWPLRIVSFSPIILPRQRGIAKRALCRIGLEMGIRRALISL